jgi:tetratricopeptide (TPR) repeat protein
VSELETAAPAAPAAQGDAPERVSIFSPREIALFLAGLLIVGWLVYPNEYTRGMMHREQGDRANAIAFFKGYLARHPSHKGATLALAAAYEAAGRPEEGVAPVREFYRRRRGDLDTGMLLLDLLERQGDLAGVEEFRWELAGDLRALPRPPAKAIEELLYRCFQDAASRQDDEAMLRALEALAKAGTTGGDYRAEMLRLLMERRRLGAAVEMLRQAQRKDPANVELRRAIARALILDNRDEEALKELDVALKLKPGHLGVLMDRAGYFTAHKRWDLAEKEYERLMVLQPGEASWPRELGRSLIARGKFREGVGYYKTLVAKDPGDREAWMTVVYAYADKGEHEEAARELEAYLRRFPDDADAAELLIYEQQNAGQLEKALATLRERVKARPQDAARRQALANMLVGEELFAESEEHYAALVKLRPENVEHWKMLSFVQQTQRRHAEAAGTLERYLERFPDDGKAVESLSGLYLELGEKRKAVELLRAYFKKKEGAP